MPHLTYLYPLLYILRLHLPEKQRMMKIGHARPRRGFHKIAKCVNSSFWTVAEKTGTDPFYYVSETMRLLSQKCPGTKWQVPVNLQKPNFGTMVQIYSLQETDCTGCPRRVSSSWGSFVTLAVQKLLEVTYKTNVLGTCSIRTRMQFRRHACNRRLLYVAGAV